MSDQQLNLVGVSQLSCRCICLGIYQHEQKHTSNLLGHAASKVSALPACDTTFVKTPLRCTACGNVHSNVQPHCAAWACFLCSDAQPVRALRPVKVASVHYDARALTQSMLRCHLAALTRLQRVLVDPDPCFCASLDDSGGKGGLACAHRAHEDEHDSGHGARQIYHNAVRIAMM